MKFCNGCGLIIASQILPVTGLQDLTLCIDLNSPIIRAFKLAHIIHTEKAQVNSDMIVFTF